MASSDWTLLTGVLTSPDINKGVSVGFTPPNGGGSTVYGIRSAAVVDGVVAMHNNQASFAPMTKGGSITGAIQRAAAFSGGKTGFAPFLFFGLQSAAVGAVAYMLGLSDEDPSRIMLRKGALTDGLAAGTTAPATAPNIIAQSSDTYDPDEWFHLKLETIVQGGGDVLLGVFRNDLTAHAVTSPVWEAVPGMVGSVSGYYVDDALGAITGSAPLASGRAGFGAILQDTSRLCLFDHLTVDRQL